MARDYKCYYERTGRGEKKKYKCLFNNCGYKLPSYQGIRSHIDRTHGREIDENERRVREWREEQERIRLEKIEEEREARKIAEEEWREHRRMLPQLREENRLIKIKKAKEEEERLREEKRTKELWNEAQRANERERVREAKLWFLFLSELEKSDLSYQEKDFQLSTAEKIGPAWFINLENINPENFFFGGDNAMDLNKELNSKKTIKQIQKQELMEAYVGRAKKGERPDSMSTMTLLKQIRNIDKSESSRNNNFIDEMIQFQMMQTIINPQVDVDLQNEVADLKHQMQMQQMINQQQLQQRNQSSQQFMQQMVKIRYGKD